MRYYYLACYSLRNTETNTNGVGNAPCNSDGPIATIEGIRKVEAIISEGLDGVHVVLTNLIFLRTEPDT